MTDQLLLAIWWLSPHEMSAIEDYLDDTVPAYLQQEYRRLLGRAGRGRLWVPDDIDLESIEWQKGPIGDWCDNCGGIVFWRTDIAHLLHYPGLITDVMMKRIEAQA